MKCKECGSKNGGTRTGNSKYLRHGDSMAENYGVPAVELTVYQCNNCHAEYIMGMRRIDENRKASQED